MEELKPCPFCGSTGERIVDHSPDCYLYIRFENHHYCNRTSEEMKKAWNERHERTCQKVPGKMKYGTRMPKCSNCDQSLGDRRWNYCPKCGCKVVD